MPLSLDKQNVYRAQYAAKRRGWRPATEQYEALIRELLRPDQRVLDMGCGRGGVLEQLGAAVACPVGIDPDHLSLVEHRLPEMPRAVALSDAIPLPDASVDLVVSSWVLEHLQDPARTFREVARVLRPGGALVFITPSASSPAALLNRVFGRFQGWLVPLLYGRDESDAFPVVYRANAHRQLDRLAQGAGLQPHTFKQIEDPTYFAFHPLLFRLSAAAARVMPARMREHIVAAYQK